MNIQQHPDRARQPRSGRQLSPLPPGTRAPAFTLRCGPHCVVTLDDFRGRPVVLAFYVADWHPVCGAQLALYQELRPELERLGAALVGISTDSLWSHAAFARAHRLQFPLLADHAPRGAVARAYGVYDRRAGTCRRALFVLDGDGTIRWSAGFPDAVNPGADGILTALETLNGAAGGVTAPASVVELPRGPPGGLADMAGNAAPGIRPGGLEVPVRVQVAFDAAGRYRVRPDLRGDGGSHTAGSAHRACHCCGRVH